jgi:hypothetical protein
MTPMPPLDVELTPTQWRILSLLADGQAHPAEELRHCLYDELGTNDNVRWHVFKLRQRLQSFSQDIVCRGRNTSLTYRLVQFVTSNKRN